MVGFMVFPGFYYIGKSQKDPKNLGLLEEDHSDHKHVMAVSVVNETSVDVAHGLAKSIVEAPRFFSFGEAREAKRGVGGWFVFRCF